MSLPKVHVVLTADGRGEVWLNDTQLPGVLAVQIVGLAGDQPRVVVTLRPGQLTADLPETGLQIVTAGPSAADFADQINPARLEALALESADLDVTQGEVFAAAVQQMAAEFDQAHHD